MIHITATAADRLFIGASAEAGNHTPTLLYVPGTMVLGAVAARWIRQFGTPQSNPRRAEFVELFHGSIRWSALMPDGAVREPMSVQVCKYGSRLDGDPCQSFANDTAYAAPVPQCPICQGPTEHAKGALRGVRSARTTRVQLELTNGREHAADGGLYSREAIEAGTTLHGTIDGTHPWLTELAGGTVSVWFGGARSVAGRCDLTLRTVEPPPPPLPLPDPTRVVIRLDTPGVFVDDNGRPLAGPDPRSVGEILGVDVTIQQAHYRTGQIHGWHAASGLPRPADIACLPGSVWVLDCATAPGPDALGALARGIGLRQTEGFGAVTVNPAPYTSTLTVAPAAVSDDNSASAVSRIANKLSAAFPNASDQRWAAGLLRRCVHERRRGAPTDLSKRAEVSRLTVTQRDALLEAADNQSIDELAQATRVLELLGSSE